MRTLSTWTLTTALALTALACDTATTPTAPDAETFGGAWELQAFETPGGNTLVPDPSQYTIEFTEQDQAHVGADCNVCNGPYELDGGSLTIGLMACTLAACLPNSLHADYVRALGSVTTWQISGNELTLAYADGVMRFRAP